MIELSDTNPFNEVVVVPNHGDGSALIEWSLDASKIDVKCSDFLVRRSPDGHTNIKIVGKPKKVDNKITSYSFLDDDAYKGSRGRTWHYQVVLRESGKAFYSGWVAARGRDPLLFGKEEEAADPEIELLISNDSDEAEELCILPELDAQAYSEPTRTRNQQDAFLKRQELGIARKIMNLERLQMRVTGTRLLVFKRLLEGDACTECRDIETNQIRNTVCPKCYNTGIIGGYDKPVCVYAQNITHRTEEIKPRETGEGEDDKTIQTFRYVSSPEIDQHDILVQVHDDLRFVVERVEKFMFKGKQPLISHITSSMVHRDDIIYKLPADCDLTPLEELPAPIVEPTVDYELSTSVGFQDSLKSAVETTVQEFEVPSEGVVTPTPTPTPAPTPTPTPTPTPEEDDIILVELQGYAECDDYENLIK